ncbi:MAG: MBL fold metallo-hydrolase [Ignavibacteriales bacterium]|nr:MBL fold metallo-hydrolase [Ignavibacteriales bacterium]
MRIVLCAGVLALGLLASGCGPIPGFFLRISSQIPDPIETVSDKITDPIHSNVGLSVLWVGHATLLIQIHEKVFLTDPLFTNTVGMVAKRLVEPGIEPSSVSRVDYTLISHIHLDHFSYGSLSLLPKNGKLLLPSGSAHYVPEFGFLETRELTVWETLEEDGVRVTAVPVQHFAGRYGFDTSWMRNSGFTGYVIEYKGVTVFFGGDTGYHPEYFKEIGSRFSIDVALLLISPVEPRDFMRRVHLDPAEAIQVFEDLHARILIPMHYRTFMQGFDPTPGYPLELLRQGVEEKRISDRVVVLDIGEQKILKK